MLDILRERLRQGYRTGDFPRTAPTLSDRFRGLPTLDAARCPEGCDACLTRCPYHAIVRAADNNGAPGALRLDLGRCLFCADCPACPQGLLTFTADYRLAARTREDLWLGVGAREEHRLAQGLDARLRSLFGRSLQLRQVSAGGCNACEADLNVLSTLVFDLGRFGIRFVASPRHADGVMVTGPVTRNMESALLETYAALPEPRLVIASGACAIAGGPFAASPEARGGVDGLLPVDLYIPGCPPHPYTALDGLLRLLGRI
ncbi:MAG: hydrogenase [Desulfovibrionaceae bacterium]|jgi:Ni,Fe-hydrogenase III small subunit/formate hydrogenlyase subunit 6/NADH:ubiquinone oxidoreductase subunit I|nr:hydrogenase [Desulfovibrionaceae bacterium]